MLIICKTYSPNLLFYIAFKVFSRYLLIFNITYEYRQFLNLSLFFDSNANSDIHTEATMNIANKCLNFDRSWVSVHSCLHTDRIYCRPFPRMSPLSLCEAAFPDSEIENTRLNDTPAYVARAYHASIKWQMSRVRFPGKAALKEKHNFILKSHENILIFNNSAHWSIFH